MRPEERRVAITVFRLPQKVDDQSIVESKPSPDEFVGPEASPPVFSGSWEGSALEAADALGLKPRELLDVFREVSVISQREEVILIHAHKLICVIRGVDEFLVLHPSGAASGQASEFCKLFPQIYVYVVGLNCGEVLEHEPEFVCLESVLLFEAGTLLSQYREVCSQPNGKAGAPGTQALKAALGQTHTAAKMLCQMLERVLRDDELIARLSFRNQILLSLRASAFIERRQLEAAITLGQGGYFMRLIGDDSDSSSTDSSESVLPDADLPISATTIEDFLETYLFTFEALARETARRQAELTRRLVLGQLDIDRQRNAIMTTSLAAGIVDMGFSMANLVCIFFGANILNPWMSDPPGPLLQDPEGMAPLSVIFTISLLLGLLGSLAFWLLWPRKCLRLE